MVEGSKVSPDFDYDVICVGAGPAGSTTARFTARAGSSVLMLDRKKEIGVPVQCGEYIPSSKEIHSILPQIRNPEELFDIDESEILRELIRIDIVSPSGKLYPIPFDGISVHRRTFDKYLVRLAQAEGAGLKINTSVTGIDGNTVHTNQGDITAKVIVGADGPQSNVARHVGLKPPTNLCRCLLSNVSGDYEPYMKIYFGKIAPGGYAWVVPKDEGANIGLGVQKRYYSGSLKDMFDKFMADQGKVPLWTSAGVVPMGGPIPKTVKENVLIVGDAAGHVMAVNGGGTPIAMICARIAGETIGKHLNTGASLEEYEREWRQKVGGILSVALRTKRLADRTFRYNSILNLSMAVMGPKFMERAIKCKPLLRW